ncbi:protein-disulfide reductase DsbD [Steroidobacter denitrificans]|uniref:protein-disulfide reductase DsbD n=1 Tax=Steroidobacter denitrificans TaxID=465721 RepID=UPI001AEF54D0|nr:protein-disulfide reductase DsbD [Steroidobacter denitrificans]
MTRSLTRSLSQGLSCLLLYLAAMALLPPASAAEDFLQPEQAYRYAGRVDDGQLILTWTIEPGYYLYKSRMGIAATTPGAVLGEPRWPPGESHTDEFFGTQEIYRGTIEVPVALSFASTPPAMLELELKLQGCADAGLCYPPLKWKSTLDLDLAPRGAGPGTAAVAPPGNLRAGGARALFGRGPAGADDFLSPDEAFRFDAGIADADTLTLTWIIAAGYYLYRDQIQIESATPGILLSALRLPAGQPKHDDSYGDTEVYYGVLEATLPIVRTAGSGETLDLRLRYQGCAEDRLCYNPVVRTVALMLPPAVTAGSASIPAASTGALPAGPRSRLEPAMNELTFASRPSNDTASNAAAPAEQDRLASLIREGRLPIVLATFFGLGVLLSLTPCVLPMIPILSGIIVGQGGKVTPARGFSLALVYVQGMALTYAAAGAAFVLAFKQAPQAFFQQPWIIVVFAALFVALALAMFGAYDLQLPGALQTRLASISNRQKSGTWIGTFVMGALSALIVTACVAPAIIAALSVISQTGLIARGAGALYATGLGMGLPLLIVGASAGSLLPKAGPWMSSIKSLFGVLFLAVAIYLLNPLLPGGLVLLLWALLAVTTGFWILSLKSRDGTAVAAPVRGLGVIMLVYGILLLIGAASGGRDPLQPLDRLRGVDRSSTARELEFQRIKTLDDLQRAIRRAGAAGKSVMFDVYADWCISCKEMEKYTFTDPGVRAALAGVVLLQADVTANDGHDQALMQYLGIFGPPTIAFFGVDGVERKNFRLVGFVPAERFQRHVTSAFSG